MTLITATLAPLTEADHDMQRAADSYGTPLVYYSLRRLRAQIERLRNAMSGYPVRLLFATMANDRPEILRALAAEGVGACVNSLLHLQKAFSQGFPAASVQFTSCGLPVTDMSLLQSLNIRANLDSLSQIKTWCSLKPGAVAGARINAAALVGPSAVPDRIGMDINDFLQARAAARSLGGRVNGIHVYAGTNFQNARDILPALRGILSLAEQHPDLDYVNIGGGIGVDYSHSAEPFDYEEFGHEVCALARDAAHRRGKPFDLIFEPGRSLVAASGEFITAVTDVKILHDSCFVTVDASVAVFPRPFHHPGNFHNVRVLSRGPQQEDYVPATVVGRTTFSKDILGSYMLPESIEVGDLLLFEDAGAYCESMISRFLGQAEPRYVCEE